MTTQINDELKQKWKTQLYYDYRIDKSLKGFDDPDNELDDDEKYRFYHYLEIVKERVEYQIKRGQEIKDNHLYLEFIKELIAVVDY